MRRAVLAGALGAALALAGAAGAAAEPVAVTVHAEPGRVAEAVQALGPRRITRRQGRALQVIADRGRIPELRRLPGVAAAYAAPSSFADGLESEGLARTGAAVLARVAGGGRGVTIAVLDQGFGTRIPLFQSLGELPPAGRLLTQSFDTVNGLAGTNAYGNPTNHGELVAQTVYDYAPEAYYLFVNYDTEADFVAATNWLTERRPDIVVHSNSFLEGPFDGTGASAKAVDRAAGAGILWFNSAGNYATKHWSGPWADAAGDGVLDWPAPDWTFAAGYGDTISFSLSWTPGAPKDKDDPPTDLDLTLERQDPEGWVAVARSGDAQVDGAPPAERILGYSPAPATYRLRANLVAGPPPGAVTLFSREIDLPEMGGSPVSSIPTPGDAAGSITVGAIDWRGNRYKRYSSQGPTDDGRLKPDLVAPTDTRVVDRNGGPRRVGGTSNAAPNAAGAAAIMLAAARRAGQPVSAASVRAELAALALDLGPLGPDPTFGAGRVRLETTPPKIVAAPPAPARVRARPRPGGVPGARPLRDRVVVGAGGRPAREAGARPRPAALSAEHAAARRRAPHPARRGARPARQRLVLRVDDPGRQHHADADLRRGRDPGAPDRPGAAEAGARGGRQAPAGGAGAAEPDRAARAGRARGAGPGRDRAHDPSRGDPRQRRPRRAGAHRPRAAGRRAARLAGAAAPGPLPAGARAARPRRQRRPRVPRHARAADPGRRPRAASAAPTRPGPGDPHRAPEPPGAALRHGPRNRGRGAAAAGAGAAAGLIGGPTGHPRCPCAEFGGHPTPRPAGQPRRHAARPGDGPSRRGSQRRNPMPLEREVKSVLRDKVSTANKSNVDAVMEQVLEARSGLAEDDKDHARLSGWLEDLEAVKGGGVPGKFS